MSLVSVKYVPSYDDELLYRAIVGHFEMLGADHDITPDLRVLIKPNLLAARKPDTAVTTHHCMAAAVIKYLRERHVRSIVVADSSSGPHLQASIKAVYASAGYVRDEIAPYLNYDMAYRCVECRGSRPARAFNIITPVMDADYIINLPKLKTHAMITMSAGVKNLFGVIPGLQKPDMHRRFPEPADFCAMLCQLAQTVKPELTILDAVDSMEGNGPGGGTVKHTGLTLASKDAFSLDAAAAAFMGLEAKAVPHLVQAQKMGFFTAAPEFCGDDFYPCPEPFVMPDTVKSTNLVDVLPAPFRKAAAAVLDRLLRSYPHVDESKCAGCGKCAESCPQKIISLSAGTAKMPRRNCISCFCCQEVCPVHAISARRVLDK